jgi:sugar lactone lactonase YvrE
MRTITAECVQREEAIVGESPVWCSRERVLFWVDITGQKIHQFSPSTHANETFKLPHPVTALAVRKQGGLVLSLKKRFALFDLKSQELTYLGDPEPDLPDNRFNDAKCDRQGRFWAGTMGNVHWDAPCGALYRLDADGTITKHQTDVVCANGMGWSPDNGTMYFTESFRYAIYAYDFDAKAGALSNRRVFASLERSKGGFPDGLTVDAEGHVWSVHNAIGKVVRYTPGGEIERVVDLPVPRPCGCAFGDEKLDALYITTARETLTPEQIAKYPLSGSLFAADVGVSGLPEAEFAG